MSNRDGRRTVLHLAPHPDDELIGAPAALFALRDSGWQVVNLACSLGSGHQTERRLSELRLACERAGFELEIVREPLSDPLDQVDAHHARARLEAEVADALGRHDPALVIGPSPHDRHPGHEIVGRAAVGALQADAGRDQGGRAAVPATPLWLWGLWADLPFPTLLVGFDDRRLHEITGALSAHAGELERNDYGAMLRGRALMLASLGPERVLGFGSAAGTHPYVELLCEVVPDGTAWRAGSPRWLDVDTPLVAPTAVDLGEWIHAPSLTDRFGTPPVG